MPPPKRTRDERDGPNNNNQRHNHERRLYLIFDDWENGYSIREIKLSPASRVRRRRSRRRLEDPDLQPEQQQQLKTLPPPSIRFGAPRRLPWLFAAIGTKIIPMHGVPEGCLPVVDVQSRGVTFGPWKGYQYLPIFFPIADHELFILDTFAFRSLSLKLEQPLWCPVLEENTSNKQWSWRDLPDPPFSRHDVTSYAVHPDGHTILVSTATTTYTFDTAAAEPAWKQCASRAMPFTGRAQFVDELNAFVGLSKDKANSGQLCSAGLVSLEMEKLGEEKLFSEDPAERHVGATLLYMGGTEFCLVHCVSIGDTTSTPDDADQEQPEPQELLDRLQEVLRGLEQGRLVEVEGITASPKGEVKNVQYIYRLMTFSVGYDSDDGCLTTGESCRLQCYKLPEEMSEASFYHDPVAFWL
ncbi:unnamed protein product [Urochloa humidicola]